MSSTAIFIGSPGRSFKSVHSYSHLFLVPPNKILFRIMASFMLPFSEKYRVVYVDFLGPILGFLFLTSLLVYGYSLKKYKMGVSPTAAMLSFAAFMPAFCFILAKLGKSAINLYQTVALVGYSLYGHLLTLLVSFIFFQETSNVFFFMSLIVFGGASSLRLTLIFLKTIPVPVVRLLICSPILLVNILFPIYLHFGFMHRTFS